MRRARPLIVAAVMVAVLALIGCGDDTDEKNEYVGQVNDVTATLNTGLGEVANQAGALPSPADSSRVFRDFAAQLDTAAAEISAISPPEDVADLHDRLVEQLERLSAEATNAADEISAGGQAAVAGVATQFVAEANSLSAEADGTIAEINSVLQE
ncbi:MAG TPA: hypothetical protein VHH72_00255 [Solirubrobacterales bacterium]|jgi:hypothetical protein|nr:hypothetical protein [Solirubrobacterales bacterium]